MLNKILIKKYLEFLKLSNKIIIKQIKKKRSCFILILLIVGFILPISSVNAWSDDQHIIINYEDAINLNTVVCGSTTVSDILNTQKEIFDNNYGDYIMIIRNTYGVLNDINNMLIMVYIFDDINNISLANYFRSGYSSGFSLLPKDGTFDWFSSGRSFAELCNNPNKLINDFSNPNFQTSSSRLILNRQYEILPFIFYKDLDGSPVFNNSILYYSTIDLELKSNNPSYFAPVYFSFNDTLSGLNNKFYTYYDYLNYKQPTEDYFINWQIYSADFIIDNYLPNDFEITFYTKEQISVYPIDFFDTYSLYEDNGLYTWKKTQNCLVDGDYSVNYTNGKCKCQYKNVGLCENKNVGKVEYYSSVNSAFNLSLIR